MLQRAVGCSRQLGRQNGMRLWVGWRTFRPRCILPWDGSGGQRASAMTRDAGVRLRCSSGATCRRLRLYRGAPVEPAVGCRRASYRGGFPSLRLANLPAAQWLNRRLPWGGRPQAQVKRVRQARCVPWSQASVASENDVMLATLALRPDTSGHNSVERHAAGNIGVS
jgi:hypothetical protein